MLYASSGRLVLHSNRLLTIAISTRGYLSRIQLLHFSTLASNVPLDFFDHLLLSCATSRHCKQTHAQIFIAGVLPSAFLAARLISTYARCDFIFDAQKVFETALIEGFENLLLWNSILRAYVTNGYYDRTIQTYYKMMNFGVFGDGFTLPLVVRACSEMGSASLCRSVHGHVLGRGFQFHLHVVNELLGMYGKIGKMEDGGQVFDRMVIRSHLSWNIMISAFANNSDCDGSLQMFRKMESAGVRPNAVSWTSLLSSHARCGRHDDAILFFEKMRTTGTEVTAEAVAVVLSVCDDLGACVGGKMIHGYVIRGGFEDYIFVKNSLICVYGKHGDINNAKKLFLEMERKNIVSWNSLITSYAECGLCDEAFSLFLKMHASDSSTVVKHNVVSWSAVIDGFASKERGEDALKLFREMQNVNVIPSPVTICTVLSICAELALLLLGREVHGHMVRALLDFNVLVGNGLINMYTKCGSLERGRLVFEKLDNKDVISWNSMISGYGMHGYGENTLKIFNKMTGAGFKPDYITFVAVLSACSHSGRLSEGRKLFDDMIKVFGIEPQMEHYACMVDLLGRGGFLQEASDMVKSMPMEPNICILGALLNSCRMHKNTEFAEEIASRILNYEMSGSYMLLSNIYSATGRWEDSARVRISAKEKGLKKTPGQSWIEVKKKVYTFSAGNAGQTDMEVIYQTLEDLSVRMEIEGYVPDESFVLQDVDEEEKKAILYGHSEKLAIAFGHVNIPSNMPIRVMKNLRVCGDCHNWTKFFSKTTKRVVILRDNKRFHHFADGCCSCKDYW